MTHLITNNIYKSEVWHEHNIHTWWSIVKFLSVLTFLFRRIFGEQNEVVSDKKQREENERKVEASWRFYVVNSSKWKDKQNRKLLFYCFNLSHHHDKDKYMYVNHHHHQRRQRCLLILTLLYTFDFHIVIVLIPSCVYHEVSQQPASSPYQMIIAVTFYVTVVQLWRHGEMSRTSTTLRGFRIRVRGEWRSRRVGLLGKYKFKSAMTMILAHSLSGSVVVVYGWLVKLTENCKALLLSYLTHIIQRNDE
jgi:hypothetical protein